MVSLLRTEVRPPSAKAVTTEVKAHVQVLEGYASSRTLQLPERKAAFSGASPETGQSFHGLPSFCRNARPTGQTPYVGSRQNLPFSHSLAIVREVEGFRAPAGVRKSYKYDPR